jgi:glycosyltransferase involved in cell wall biosynthesis
MINRFASDDDYLTVIETAKISHEMNFFISGNYTKANDLPKNLPSNVVLTGYLLHGEFMKLMYRSAAVLAFTKRPDTVLWSVREMLALRKPFVTTDSEVMRHYFSEVALFANSEPDDIKEQMNVAIKKTKEIAQKMEEFLTKDRVRFQVDIDTIHKTLNE